ncbi:hypothetical protein F2Q69_00062012, partial [Brassica cretica]
MERTNITVSERASDLVGDRQASEDPTAQRKPNHPHQIRRHAQRHRHLHVAGRGRKKLVVQSWNWEPQRGRMLNLIANSLEINLSLLFGSSELDENYLSFIVKNSFSLFENAAILKDPEAKDALCRIIGASATKYRYIVQSCASVMHLIHKYDFAVVHVADAVARAETKYSDGTLAVTIIRDIGRTDPKAYVKDTVGADNVGRFLVELADRLPKVMSTNVGVLVPHFGGESYKIRNALVGVLGKLVAKAFNDVEGDVSSRSLRLRTKQAMLEILLERCRDVSAYTRSRVLQVWAELCEEHSVSIGLWNEVASISAGRLEDKSAIVRKSALNLLITMLQHNPFGPQLRIASFEATLEQYKRKLNELEPNRPTEDSSKEPTSDGDSCNGDGEIDDLQPEVTINTHLDSLPDSCQPDNGEDIREKDASVPDIGNVEQTKALVASLEAGLSFSKSMSASMPILVQLMASSSASDVENAILLLMRCKQFQIDGAEACLRKILPLAFSQDKSIYEAVENAFISIYIRKNPVETAKQLLNLAIDSNIGDQAALEFIVNALVSKGEISSSTTSALWDFFCFNINGTTAEQSRGALSVLCMAAMSSSRILGSHIQDIIDIGFGRWAKVEPLLARTACTAIQRLSEEDKKKLLLSSGSRLFSILESLITGNWLPENIFYATADKAISAIYMIHPTPEALASTIIKKSLSTVFDVVEQDQAQSDSDGNTVDCLTTVHVAKLSRFLFVVSHIAMNQLVAGRGRKKLVVQSWNWEPQRGRMLNLIANSLEINLSLLFGSSELDENYLSFIVKNSFSLFENAAILKDPEAKDALCRIIGASATKYRYIVQSCASVMHLIHKYDFAVVHVADAVARAESKYSDGTLAVTIIRDIGRTDPKAYVKDTVGADNVGRFLVELADRLPKVMSTNVGVLVPHFGGESYKIRNALVGVLGKLVAKAFNDVEGDVSSRSLRLRTKQAMLEILLERCRDVSAYTRSRVLQVWAELCEEHSVSIGLWNEVATISAGRLEDKSAIVRKSALNLLITMLQHNPFGPQLRIASFEATLEQYKRKLNEFEPNRPTEDSSKEPTSDGDSCNGDGEIDDLQPEVTNNTHLDSLPDSCQPGNGEDIREKDASVPDIGNVEQTKALVASLEAGLSFSKCMSASMPILVQLMASSSASDVENAILLLMRCKQFQIDGAEACLRKILPLSFSQDRSIYEAVENAFISIYIRKNPVETAKQLLNLAIDSNIGDQAALEFIVNALVSKGEISSSTTSALWDFFCFNINGTTAEQSRGALSVLCMAAKSSSRILGSHIQDIIDIGFGRWAKVEPLLARTACTAIQRLSEEDKKKLLLSSGSRLFSILESLITGNWLPENIYYTTADKAISAIYMIHPTPEALASTIIKKSLSTVFDVVAQDQEQNDTDNNVVDFLTTVHVAKLSRFLFVVSHIAMNQLVYIESCIQKIRRQKTKKDKAAAESQNTEENPGATQEVHTDTLKCSWWHKHCNLNWLLLRVSDSEIVDPSMEEQGDSLKASDSEEEPSNSEEKLSDSEEVPDSEQSGEEEEGEGESESSNVKRGNRTKLSSSSVRRSL